MNTDLISIKWVNDRLQMFDSDGKYIDYISEWDGARSKEIELNFYRHELNRAVQKAVIDFVSEHTNIYKIEEYCGNEEDMQSLIEDYGEEWVMRIGDHAIVIDETK